MKLSIVATLYQSSSFLQAFYERALATAGPLFEEIEFIFVVDGSPDDSLRAAQAIQERDGRVTIIDLSRNFGHHRAMMTGLGHTRGDRVFLIDTDLEEDPSWLQLFWERMQAENSDLVFGVQKRRKGNSLERWTGALFYRLFNLLSDAPVPPNPTTARLMTRRFVDALLLHQERELFLSGLCTITGFQQTAVPVVKQSKGSTTYSLRRRLTLAVHAITSFSEKPLVAIFYVGLLISFFAAGMILRFLYGVYYHGVSVIGWASLIVSIWFLGGLVILFLGILGIYVARIFIEAKNRPAAIIRHVYTKPSEKNL
jgi:putative glycosyltransferase